MKTTIYSKIRLLALAAMVFFLFAPLGWAATYYVDATNGKDTNTGLSTATAWKTISKVNASRFQPGDQILFKKGASWREELIVPSSGNASAPISFGAYGPGQNPIITGGSLLSGWTKESATLYYTNFVAEPKQLLKTSQRLTKVSAKSDLSAGRWWWDSSNLRIYLYDNPFGYEIEASLRNNCVTIQNKSYVIIRDLKIRASAGDGIQISATSGTPTGLIIDGLTIESNYLAGTRLWATGGKGVTALEIRNSFIFNNGGSGISITNMLNGGTLEKNVVYGNCQLIDGPANDHDWNAGIKIVSRNTRDVIIQQNQVYENGKGIGGSKGDRGVGIWVDTAGPGNIVRRNLVFNNNKHGIMVEDTNGVEVTANIVYGHASYTNARGLYISRNCKANRVLHNTLLGNRIGIAVQGTFVPNKLPGDMVGNIIQNNIAYGNTTQLSAQHGGENDGVFGYNNIYSYNCFGSEMALFIEWGNGNFKSSYNAWETIYGPSNSIRTDPGLANPAGGDYKLKTDSPCIGAGLSLGGWIDFNGNSTPQNAPVDIGALKYFNINPPKNLRVSLLIQRCRC